jgi:hypothetical protein
MLEAAQNDLRELIVTGDKMQIIQNNRHDVNAVSGFDVLKGSKR